CPTLSLPPSASPSPLPLRRQRCCTPSAWATDPSAGAAALGQHLVGRRCPCWRPLLSATALASDSLGRGATPYGLAVGSRHLRPGRGRCQCPQAPAMPAGNHTCWRLSLAVGCPYKGVLVVVGRPLKGGLSRNRPGREWSAGRPSSLFLLRTHRMIPRDLISSHAV
ncbi:hypothetical protein B296_00055828, partial [Ensete ventricosum]